MVKNINNWLLRFISAAFIFSSTFINAADSAGKNNQGEQTENGQAGTNPTDITLTVDKEGPCIDEEVTFSASTVKLNVSQWKWYIDGDLISDSANITSTSSNSTYKRMFSEPGQYECYVTANGKTSNTVVVTVHKDYKITATPKLVCVGEKITATVEGCNGNTIEKVSWEYESGILEPQGSTENKTEVTFLALGKSSPTTEIKAYINGSTEPVSVSVTVTELTNFNVGNIDYDYANNKAKVTLTGVFDPVKHSAKWSTNDDAFFDAAHSIKATEGEAVTVYVNLPANNVKCVTVTAECGNYPVSKTICFFPKVSYFIDIETPLCVDGEIKAVLKKRFAGGAALPCAAYRFLSVK